jgi:hypothetical protein
MSKRMTMRYVQVGLILLRPVVRLFSAVWLCGMVGACVQPEPIPPVEFTRSEWTFEGRTGTEIITPHYRIRTTCKNPQLLGLLPEFVESCWAAYAELMPPEVEPTEPAMTYLFETRPEWEKFTKQFSPTRARTYLLIRSGGYEEQGTTVSHYDRMATTMPVMAHEGLHQFVSHTRRERIPAWVNEGLACYFEAFVLDGAGRAVFRPRNNLIRRNNLREAFLAEQLFDLKELLTTNAGEVVGLPSARVRTYYAQAWSVVLFLLDVDPKNEPMAAGFRRLLQDLGTERMRLAARAAAMSSSGGSVSFGEAIFRAYVTTDYEMFQQNYERYVRQLLRID